MQSRVRLQKCAAIRARLSTCSDNLHAPKQVPMPCSTLKLLSRYPMKAVSHHGISPSTRLQYNSLCQKPATATAWLPRCLPLRAAGLLPPAGQCMHCVPLIQHQSRCDWKTHLEHPPWRYLPFPTIPLLYCTQFADPQAPPVKITHSCVNVQLNQAYRQPCQAQCHEMSCQTACPVTQPELTLRSRVAVPVVSHS